MRNKDSDFGSIPEAPLWEKGVQNHKKNSITQSKLNGFLSNLI